jgi:phosphinothricin acetyltransferase
VIRAAHADDAEDIARVYAAYVTGSVASFEREPPSASEMGRRMGSGYPWLVACDDEAVLGYAYGAAHRERPAYRWSVEVSVYVAEGAQRRGLGRELYGALLPLLARLGYVRAFAGITLPNDASVGLHEALGFTPVGVFHEVGFKLGGWRDVGWWQRPLQDPPPREPPEPRRWDSRLEA